MWTVSRIDEADFGCEERLPGEPLMVLVTIESDDGRVFKFECAEDWLMIQGIDEGDEWPDDVDAVDEDSQRANQMSDWMDSYYKALEERDSID